jgi:uncharacterized membrane protein YjjP (DUF1212 family)
MSDDVYKTMNLALRIGEVLLSSGAGAADVGAQMDNVGRACGLRRFSADVTFTELAMSHQPAPDEPALMQVRQVRHREVDYEHLTLVDHLVRDLVGGTVDRDEAAVRLNRIVSGGHARPRWCVTLGLGVMGAGVGLLLGGSAVMALIAFLAACSIDLIQRFLARRRLPAFYQQAAGGLFATLLAAAVSATGLDIAPSRVITASIIALLAGVSFLGAIQDALTAFPLTAGARLLEAMVATAGVIGGVSGGLALAKTLGVGLGRLDPGAVTFGSAAMMCVGAAVAAAAYAFAAHAPYRALAPIAVIAALATGLFDLIYSRQWAGLAWASGVAALFIGLVSFAAAARVKVPALVIVTATIVPLLPGLSIYRGLAELSEGAGSGLIAMVTAAAVAIALSSGVILGEYIAQPVQREARRLERKLVGPRLVGPSTMRAVRRRRGNPRRRSD